MPHMLLQFMTKALGPLVQRLCRHKNIAYTLLHAHVQSYHGLNDPGNVSQKLCGWHIHICSAFELLVTLGCDAGNLLMSKRAFPRVMYKIKIKRTVCMSGLKNE